MKETITDAKKNFNQIQSDNNKNDNKIDDKNHVVKKQIKI